ncbi:diacylglycerol kinase [Candidatus Saccharibacteria bacterium]|nr:diacylglycerol kinase [Candidatus Saccharibacteria bacterium]NIV04216.1 diacylglycerol kinase [Calditrichia bacterium]NIS38737.1 diacylglycerol kinase [Candidatus Saccharibacteria bacterium]NIV72664.1 diacylglycerol kinase [Calditrichia bacterium]NIV99816.1 diacylglycerol kinase [Candidatus Saccharibacteria bacterium]
MGIKRLGQSFKFAGKGLWLTFREEQSFRIQALAAIVIIIFMIVFPLGAIERLLLVAVIVAVLVLEIINSIFERIVDVYKPRLNPYVKDIKDMMAAAVLVASIGAVVIGIMIFYPHVLNIWIK